MERHAGPQSMASSWVYEGNDFRILVNYNQNLKNTFTITFRGRILYSLLISVSPSYVV